MNPEKRFVVFRARVSINLCAFCLILALIIQESRGTDPWYDLCVPKSCGTGPNISFPFYAPQLQQDSHCGSPGYELACSETGHPLLAMGESRYIVENIFYNNRSLRVYDAAIDVVSSPSGCLPEIKNVSFNQDRYNFATEISHLHLFSNCNQMSSSELRRYELSCGGSGNGFGWKLAMLDTDEGLMSAKEQCNYTVLAPVEVLGETPSAAGSTYHLEQLRNGFLLNWTASDCNVCTNSGGRCGFNATNGHFRCFCTDRPHAWSCKSRGSKLKVILGTTIPAGLLILVICSVIILLHRKRGRNIVGYFLSRNTSFEPSTKQDVEGGSVYLGVSVFSYSELEEATNNFDPSKELGDGGFGAVYHGKLRDGREVAVKRLYEHNYKRMEQFMNEIRILTRLKHSNLVLLYGCTSRRSQELLLVYEYISNGTVADHLHGDRAKDEPLTWDTRMNIAIETASALAYLHASDTIHRDVKTTNILLDHKFCVKVADFGLSRLFPNDVTHVSTAPQGTPGYVDPEYHQCYQLTDKSDVYSFGVVLIELISSMPAVDISRHRHEINLANLAINKIQRCAFDELIDPALGFHSDAEVHRMTTCVAELAFRCLQLEKDMRPTMEEVLETLQEIKGGEYKSDQKAGSNCRPTTLSPESEDVVLLKDKKFQPSPNCVTDVWMISSSSTISNSG